MAPRLLAGSLSPCGTLLPLACGVPNGESCQKPTINVRPTGMWERQKLGRLQTGSLSVLFRPKWAL